MNPVLRRRQFGDIDFDSRDANEAEAS